MSDFSVPQINLNQDQAIAGSAPQASNAPTPNMTSAATNPALNTTPKSPETSMPSRSKSGNFLSRLSSRQKKTLGIVGGVLLALIVLGGGLGFYTLSVVNTLQAQAQEAELIGQQAFDNFKGQNLPATQQALKDLQGKVQEMRGTYNRLGLYLFIPVASSYYSDGVHGFNAADAGINAGLKSVDAVTPYADVLGFTGADASLAGGTAEDRLNVLLQTLDKVSPQLDSIAADLEVTRNELAEINPNRYPETIQGKNIRSNIIKAQETTDAATKALVEYRPVLEQLPSIAGAKDGRKQYLILFQNDNELRATGGFLTAYAIINIENGKVTPETSDDIYSLDQQFRKQIPIPEALGRYLTTESRWNLRDMNISPDFKTSMDQFLANYTTLPNAPKELDGVIAVDTHLLTDLLTVLGPIEVPGYGTFSAEEEPRCNCPQVVYALSEIITRPTPYLRPDRKGILGPMMRSLLTKAYAAPNQQWPQLMGIGLNEIAQRHVQMYFFDESAQKSAETINAAGRMMPVENSDFLGIVDANLGGAKSNLFVDYEVEQVISAPENGMITKTVEITYKNSRRGDNCNLEAGLLCLNSTLRDWNRLYLPAGSELVEAQGFTAEPKVYQEAGFQVVDGFFILEPNSQAKVRVTYKVPYTDTETYRLKLWKQGGISPVKTLLEVNGNQEEVTMDKDLTFETAF